MTDFHSKSFTRQAISNDERIKSGLDFLYDAPPGLNKGKLFDVIYLLGYRCTFP